MSLGSFVGPAVLLSAIALASPSQSAIYRYFGDPVVESTYSSGLPDGAYASAYGFVGPLGEGPLYDIEFTYAGALPKNAIFEISAVAGSFKMNGFGVDRLPGSVDFFTDATGAIVNWNITFIWDLGSGLDQIYFVIDSAGDYSLYRYTYEYAWYRHGYDWSEPAGPGDFGVGAEVVEATGFGTGAWSIVPVPASLPLLGVAALVLGALGRRRRSA